MVTYGGANQAMLNEIGMSQLRYLISRRLILRDPRSLITLFVLRHDFDTYAIFLYALFNRLDTALSLIAFAVAL
ncbi:hypothetical protein GJ744_003229 [Endocarpon pusillum]|uniref:Uncharacterized protein n=1 Tax=Endocarpon pusillum TaxID=364733 RepID=A0A8H7AAA6_9EURO|nr:hypothetical protein GJ744_003229 [Endocarpon pusillum]